MTFADQLREHVGMWVAVKDNDVLFSAGSPAELLEWIRENGQIADACFRVEAGR